MPAFTVQLSRHAVERFSQRVRPGLSFTDAEDQLAHLVLVGDLVDRAPDWHAACCAQLSPWYLVVGDVLLPLTPRGTDPSVLVATTCLVRGERSPDVRRRRRIARRIRRPGQPPAP